MEEDLFYQVVQKGVVVGHFKKRANAKKYAEEFVQNIGGYNYPIKIVKKEFLDNVVEDDA
jgi:hypothetical protein|tara:strand:- start:814 stop:993 length:180 start_codon:yes stop_codon:yes gene_type:complete